MPFGKLLLSRNVQALIKLLTHFNDYYAARFLNLFTEHNNRQQQNRELIIPTVRRS